jgi:threonine/homoserine/homoserine lactone efflux protein
MYHCKDFANDVMHLDVFHAPDFLMALSAAAGISFVGSLQVGLVNSRVFSYAVTGKKKEAIWAAVGGALPEFIYCLVACVFIYQVMDIIMAYKQIIQAVSSVLLVTFALVLWFSAKKHSPSTEPTVTPNRKQLPGFLQGLSIAMLNPQLIIFWSTVSAQYTAMNGSFNFYTLLAFCLGAFIGALLLLIGVVLLAQWLSKRLKQIHYFYLMRTVSVVLLALGISLATITFLGM